MGLHLRIAQRNWAAQGLILALELHGVELLLHLLLNADEARLLALHGALAGLLRKLVEAHLMEALLALFALPGLYEDGRAEGAEKVARYPTFIPPRYHILTVQCEAHTLEIVRSLALPILSQCLSSKVFRPVLILGRAFRHFS